MFFPHLPLLNQANPLENTDLFFKGLDLKTALMQLVFVCGRKPNYLETPTQATQKDPSS